MVIYMVALDEPNDIIDCIKDYISWRIQQLNDGKQVYNHKAEAAVVTDVLTKKQIRELKNELISFGGLVVKAKPESEVDDDQDMNLKPVHVLIDDLEVGNFIVDGVIKVQGGFVIGYFCKDCLLAVPVNESDWLFYDNQGAMTCVTYQGDNIGVIYDSNIITNMGY